MLTLTMLTNVALLTMVAADVVFVALAFSYQFHVATGAGLVLLVATALVARMQRD